MVDIWCLLHVCLSRVSPVILYIGVLWIYADFFPIKKKNNNKKRKKAILYSILFTDYTDFGYKVLPLSTIATRHQLPGENVIIQQNVIDCLHAFLMTTNHAVS